jgi:hypothetical protein
MAVRNYGRNGISRRPNESASFDGIVWLRWSILGSNRHNHTFPHSRARNSTCVRNHTDGHHQMNTQPPVHLRSVRLSCELHLVDGLPNRMADSDLHRTGADIQPLLVRFHLRSYGQRPCSSIVSNTAAPRSLGCQTVRPATPVVPLNDPDMLSGNLLIVQHGVERGLTTNPLWNSIREESSLTYLQ